MNDYVSDVAFSPSVKEAQRLRGSRQGYETMAKKGDWSDVVNDDLRAFITERDSFYLATANNEGQPYIQHRGGPKGFLRVLDERTLAFADYSGNRQFISVGNLAENELVNIFLMDYANRQRVKIWGRVQVVEDDADLLARVSPDGYAARPERVFLITITAWDVNCPQHIVQRYDDETVRQVTGKLATRVAELEAENELLKEQLATVSNS